ncbi:MAG: hypothetical protein JNG85_16265 [Spirochaetaceae bacterium]|nr:hypothetical protein [Spirochaetaceae bacterium]
MSRVDNGTFGRASRALRPLFLAFTGFACALVLGFTAYNVASSRSRLIETERESLLRFAETVAAQTEGLFGNLEFFLRSIDLWLASHPEADPRFDRDFVAFVDAFRDSQGGMIDVRLVSQDGGLFYIPSKDRKPLAEVSDRAYFRAQLDPATRGFHIAVPVLSRVTGLWGIPISYPLEAGNAGMSLAFAAIELPDLDGLYETIRPKPNGAVTLFRGDGIVLARTPFNAKALGASFGTPEGWSRLLEQGSPGAQFTRMTDIEGQVRLAGYRAIPRLGLVVSVSSLEKDILAPWLARLPFDLGFCVATLAILAALAARLLGYFDRLAATRRELTDNLARLEASRATRDKLFSIISHDLRGPLGGMRNFLEGLVADRENLSRAELGESLGVLATTAAGTTELLEELLEWARAQQGELRFEPLSLPLAPLAVEVSSILESAASAKELHVVLEIEEGLKVHADADMLRTLLRNLLGNAVKYSKRGGTVRLAAARAEEAGMAGVRVDVSDEGIGMDEELLAKVFDAVSLRSRPGTAGERGSGLGLAICKDFAERHGGTLEARSEPGKGSTFELFLPGPKAAPAS